MLVKTNFESVDKAMATVTAIVNDKMLNDDLKNVIIWCKDGKVRFVANSGNIVSATDIEAELELDPDEQVQEEIFVQLKSKDITDVLATLRGLRRTKVTGLEFHIKDNEAVLHVIESPIDEMMNFASDFNRVSKFRVTKTRLKEIIKSEVQKINMSVEGVEFKREDVLLYLDALLPTVAKEVRESSSNIFFAEDAMYTVLHSYVAIMDNKLEGLNGFRLSNSVANFLRNFASVDDTFIFNKVESGKGLVLLTLKNIDSVAVIKCADMSRAFDITNYTTIPDIGIVVDKYYLVDVLKRINLNKGLVYVEVEIGDGQGTFQITSKTQKQSIPVTNVKGEGKFSFNIKDDLLNTMVFSHVMDFDENVYLYFSTTPQNKLVMACSDGTRLWHTKMVGLTGAKSDFAWGA